MKITLPLQILGFSCLLCACTAGGSKQVQNPQTSVKPELRWIATLSDTSTSSAPTMHLDLMQKENDNEKSIAQGTCIGSTTLVDESGSASTMRCNWENGGGDLGAFVEGDKIQINYRAIDNKTGTGEWKPVTTIQQ